MKAVLTPAESRTLDAYFINDRGILGKDLMQTAAMGVVDRLIERFERESRILIVCGTGNNGGDGFAILHNLVRLGYTAEGYIVGDRLKIQGDAAFHYQLALHSGVNFLTATPSFDLYDCIVDAIFGTGLSRPLSNGLNELLQTINDSRAYRLAVDIPSGIDGINGATLGNAFRAHETVTFQTYKRGHLLFPGRQHAGNMIVHPLVPNATVVDESVVNLLEESDVRGWLPKRPIDSHKGKNGRALLCVGSEKYVGAALLSAKATVRGGAGLTTVAVPQKLKSAFCIIPEVMCASCGESGDWCAKAQEDAVALLDMNSAYGIGCGMGQFADGLLLKEILLRQKPSVLDADALNHMAQERDLLPLLHASCVITPHPAEMARLLQCSTEHVLCDPIETARNAAEKFGCIVVLKGATTCISDGNSVFLNVSGNAGLAKGGSGDVLTGLILALLAQGIGAYQTACAATYLLGASAERAYSVLAERALCASDVVEAISQEIHEGRDR